jgi:hypothetical protein
MATPPHHNKPATKASEAPLGATDHLEQAAAQVAKQKAHQTISDEDRTGAYEQMRQTSPPAKSSPPTPEEG